MAYSLHHDNLPHLPSGKVQTKRGSRLALRRSAKRKAPLAGPRTHCANHYHLPATEQTVHWGYFGRAVEPVLEIESGDFITIETLTHHAYCDFDRMIRGDAGAESVFYWDSEKQNVSRRGIDPSATESSKPGKQGTHILTGPVAIRDARPGDVLEVRIIDVVARPSANSIHEGKAFGVNIGATWGFHCGDTKEEPKEGEVVTVYEIDAASGHRWARAVYRFRWTQQTDPFGVTHPAVDYPGIPVDHATIHKEIGILKNVRIPIRPHFGIIGTAPAEVPLSHSIPSAYTGGNIDNWRIGKGTTLYLPVAVPGAGFMVGDPHASQGDAEIGGTAIECSMTGIFQLILHKKQDLAGTCLDTLGSPLLETAEEWVVHGYSYPNYLAELGPDAQSEIFRKSSVELALRDASRKMQDFLVAAHNLDEDEAISLMSVAVDFGITQVANGNWGVHAILRKDIFVK